MARNKMALVSKMHIAAIDIEQDLKKKWRRYGFNSREECDSYLDYARRASSGYYTVVQSVTKFMKDGFGVKSTEKLLKKYPIEAFRDYRTALVNMRA